MISKSKKRIIIIVIIIIIIIGVLLLLFLLKKKSQFQTSIPVSNNFTLAPTFGHVENKPIAKVGNETIYQSDLDKEIAVYPPQIKEVDGKPVKEYLLDKIIEDSIILQESSQSSTTNSLSPNVFNSPNKNYQERTNLAQELKKEKENELIKAEGNKVIKSISIWFVNGKLSDLGYEKSRQLASDKITALYNRVKSGSITIDQAANEIKADVSLLAIDYNYAGNAIEEYTVTNKKELLFADQAFVDELWSLPPGGITKIYEVKQSSDEEFFAFGNVVSIQDASSNGQSYADWLKEQENKNQIQIY